MRVAAPIAALMLVGCASSHLVTLPSGRSGWYIECRKSYGYCLDEASRLCPRGYLVSEAESHSNGAVAQAFGNGTVVVQSRQAASMLIECRIPAAPIGAPMVPDDD